MSTSSQAVYTNVLLEENVRNFCANLHLVNSNITSTMSSEFVNIKALFEIDRLRDEGRSELHLCGGWQGMKS
jgi:hypothetical protein